MKPFVLLTPAHQISDTNLPFHQVMRGYVNCMTEAGAEPIVLTHMPAEENMKKIFDMCSGLLLTGGVDIQPHLYGDSECHSENTLDAERDELEFPLLDMFVKAKKPVMGICRGMQVIHTYFGGTLWQDLPSQLGVEHRNCLHNIKTEKGSQLNRLFGDEFEVNSFHHQAAKDMGEDMRATAWCDDVIEAIEHKSLPIWAVQYHPERLFGAERVYSTAPASENTPDTLEFFTSFVEAMK